MYACNSPNSVDTWWKEAPPACQRKRQMALNRLTWCCNRGNDRHQCRSPGCRTRSCGLMRRNGEQKSATVFANDPEHARTKPMPCKGHCQNNPRYMAHKKSETSEKRAQAQSTVLRGNRKTKRLAFSKPSDRQYLAGLLH